MRLTVPHKIRPPRRVFKPFISCGEFTCASVRPSEYHPDMMASVTKRNHSQRLAVICVKLKRGGAINGFPSFQQQFAVIVDMLPVKRPRWPDGARL